LSDVVTGEGDDAGRSRLDAEHAQYSVRGDLQHPHDRHQRAREYVERDREHHGERLGLLQRDRLRYELADHDTEVGQHAERDRERSPAREKLEVARHEWLSDRTERDPEDRDPHLRRRDEADGLVHEPERRDRGSRSLRCTFLESTTTRRDERVLGRDEYRIPENEADDHEDASQIAHRASRQKRRRAPDSGAPILDGSSSSTWGAV
jgi:hypothetical protein